MKVTVGLVVSMVVPVVKLHTNASSYRNACQVRNVAPDSGCIRGVGREIGQDLKIAVLPYELTVPFTRLPSGLCKTKPAFIDGMDICWLKVAVIG